MIWKVGILAAGFAAATALAVPAGAATRTVTDFGDTGGPGQLRTLIAAAGAGDTIVIPAGTITLAPDSGGASGIQVTQSLVIEGAGANLTALDGGGASRVFWVASGNVTISGVTIRNGNSAARGGAMYTLESSTVTLANSTISGNSSCAIIASGPLTVTNSTVSGNVGCGILAVGSLTVTGSTVSGNSLEGIAAESSTAPTTITNSTISRNARSGISTTQSTPGPVTLTNTIVADNGTNCFTLIAPKFPTSHGHNLDSDGSCGLKGPGDLSQPLDARLGPLQDNGGPTFTHALLPGSPAIDRGDDSACPPADQRGIVRPQGFACDIGAYESLAPPVTVVLNGSQFRAGQTLIPQATVTRATISVPVDVYFGSTLTDGTFASLIEVSPGVFDARVGSRPIALATGALLGPVPIVVTFPYTFQGTDPAGAYLIYGAVVVAGTPFNPLSIDPRSVLGLALESFQFIH